MAVLGLVLATTMPSRAADWTGSASTDWFMAGNWSPASVPTGLDQVSINTVTPNPTVVGATGAVAIGLRVGDSATGMLTVQNGGALSSGTSYIGYADGSNGTVTVTDNGSVWTTSALNVGHLGTGTLIIQNGGVVNTGNAVIIGVGSAGSHVAVGAVTVDGAGSTWTNISSFVVGLYATGTLTIQNGGAVSSGTSWIGRLGGSIGAVTVTGAGSSWTASSIVLGNANTSTGTLIIQNGGTVSASSVMVASQAGSVGTLNIGATSGQAAVAPGTLNTSSVAFGAGTGLIVFNHTASSYGFDPTISGAGSVRVEAGTTTLTATNTYTGATTVAGGTLLVNGSIASSSGLTVDAGATVGGTGLLPTAVVNGTLSPGAAGGGIGTIAVAGNLTFGAGGIYAVDVSPTAADRTNVTGTATLNGTVRVGFATGSYVSRQYTILHADSGLGGTTFASVGSNLPGLSATLGYGANDVFLNLTAVLGSGASLAGNSQNVASAINGYFNGVGGAINGYLNGGGALPPGFLPLFGLSGTSLSNALSQLSGEAATGAQQAGIRLTNQFLTLMLDPYAYGRGGVFGGNGAGPGGALGLASEETLPPEIALAYAKVMKAPPMPVPAAAAPQWSAWGGAFGGTGKTQGDAVAGSHDLTAKTGGFAAGLDYKVTPGTVMGFALAGGFTNWNLAGGFGGGSGDAFQAGVYAVTRPGPWYLAGALSFTQHWMKTERTAFAGNHLEGRFDAQSYGGRIETGWRVATPLGGITPYAALQMQRFHLPGFAESDLTGGGFGLAYASRNADATRSELGARFERLVAVSDTALVALQARAAWAHDWTSDATVTPMFQALPGASFVVAGATAVPDLALLSAGAELRLASGWSLAGRFDGEFADRGQTYSGTGTVRYAW